MGENPRSRASSVHPEEGTRGVLARAQVRARGNRAATHGSRRADRPRIRRGRGEKGRCPALPRAVEPRGPDNGPSCGAVFSIAISGCIARSAGASSVPFGRRERHRCRTSPTGPFRIRPGRQSPIRRQAAPPRSSARHPRRAKGELNRRRPGHELRHEAAVGEAEGGDEVAREQEGERGHPRLPAKETRKGLARLTGRLTQRRCSRRHRPRRRMRHPMDRPRARPRPLPGGAGVVGAGAGVERGASRHPPSRMGARLRRMHLRGRRPRMGRRSP